MHELVDIDIDYNERNKVSGLFAWQIATLIVGLGISALSAWARFGSPLFVIIGSVLALLGIRSYALLFESVKAYSRRDSVLSYGLVVVKLFVVGTIIYLTNPSEGGSGELLSFFAGLLSFVPASFIIILKGEKS